MRTKAETITRFSVWQRVEHFVIMVFFTLLVLTGMPQKYFASGFSAKVVAWFGGIDSTRLLHRISGFIFAGLVMAHLAISIWQLATRRLTVLHIVPHKQDYRDAMKTLRYYLGLSKEPARFDRYDYRQKFEYWGMVAGSLIMTFTGFILFWPALVASILPGQLIPAAKVMHSYEGLMAFLVVIVWHLYNAHLSPDVFPFDTSIFTGKISRERMEHEHPLELERIEGKPVEHEAPAAEAPKAKPPAAA
ncbi:MAG: formate dehydrogenase subunit gamma [Deltaproteobacteria bacterium]